MAKFDIVLPYFQRDAGVLRRTLDSVWAQTLQDYRVIIVDDGSPVPASEELQQVTSNLRDRVFLIEQSNAGVSAARNRGLDAVDKSANFVAFLDSDDNWAPEHLANALRAFTINEIDVYWDAVAGEGRFLRYQRPSKLIAPALLKAQPEPDNGRTYEVLDMRRVMYGPWWRFIHLSSTVISQPLATKLRFDETMRVAEDFEFLYQCAKAAKGVVCSDAVGLRRGTGSNIWLGIQQDAPVLTTERISMIRMLKKILREEDLTNEDRTILTTRINIAREQLYWNIRARMKSSAGLHPGVILQVIAQDPKWAIVAAQYASKVRPADDLTTIPSDDE